MITLKNLKIENFLSHESSELSFREDEKLLIGGRSGTGKSTICEAILFALYGKGRVDNRNIIRKGAKNASVELTLKEDDLCYKIERKTSEKGKQTLNMVLLNDDLSEEVIKVEGLKEKQDWIEKTLIKSSYTLFTNSILYLQDNVDTFVKQTASKRKDLLLEIANIEDYEMYYNRAKEELKLATEERVRIETLTNEKKRIIDFNINPLNTIEDLEKKETDIKDSIKTLNLQLENARANSEKQKETQRDIVILESTLSNLKRQEESYFSNIKIKESSIEFLKKVDVNAIQEGLKKLKDSKEKLLIVEKKEKEDIEHNDKIRYLIAQKPSEYDYEVDITSLNKQLISIMTSKDNYCEYLKSNCPKLQERSKGQISYIEDQIKDKQEKFTFQIAATEAYIARLNALGLQRVIDNGAQILREEIKILEHWERDSIQNSYAEEKVKDFIKEIEEIKEKIKEIKNNLTDRNIEILILKKALAENNVDWVKVEQTTNNLLIGKQSSLMTVTQELTLARYAKKIVEDTEKELILLKEKLSDILNKIDLLEIVKEAFSSKGIKTLVIDHIVPLLETKINEILSQLSDFRIRLDTQRQSADGESMVEGLFININNDIGEEHDFDAFSGGERVKITVAISEALASLQKCSFRVLDEAIQALDEESTESFIDVLNQLKDRFKQIICISHIQQVKDTFDDSIEVIKENGISRII